MTEQQTPPTLTDREFVSMVRAELSARGADVTIERSWIDRDEPGYAFLLHVPVGTELTVPIRASDDLSSTRAGDRNRRAAEFATALVNLKSAEATLLKYAKDIRRAANSTVSAARAGGLDVLLDGVGFKPTHAQHLAQASWKDAASHVLGAVTLRHTAFHLRPATSVVWVEEPADVASEIASILEDQGERQARVAYLDVLGCDLIVDAITLELLAAHGLDAQEMLRRVWKEQCVNKTVQHNGQDVPLSLVSSEGLVTASIQLEDAIWNGEHLWFRGGAHLEDHGHLIGKSVGDLVRHPVFTARPIVDVFRRHADHIVFDLSDKHLFDGDTGRIWREERLAA